MSDAIARLQRLRDEAQAELERLGEVDTSPEHRTLRGTLDQHYADEGNRTPKRSQFREDVSAGIREQGRGRPEQEGDK